MAAIKSNKKWEDGYQLIPCYQIKRIKDYSLIYGLLFF
jgi:hypothetical protein